MAGLRDDDVFGFDVAMDDLRIVRRRQPRCRLGNEVDGALRLQRAARQQRAQRLALHVLHDDVVVITIAANVQQADDVRMVEG